MPTRTEASMTESGSSAPLPCGPAATALSRGSRSSFKSPALLIFGLVLALPALSQSYGPNEQVLVVGADEFRPTFGANTAWSFGPDDGYLYGGSYYYFA